MRVKAAKIVGFEPILQIVLIRKLAGFCVSQPVKRAIQECTALGYVELFRRMCFNALISKAHGKHQNGFAILGTGHAALIFKTMD